MTPDERTQLLGRANALLDLIEDRTAELRDIISRLGEDSPVATPEPEAGEPVIPAPVPHREPEHEPDAPDDQLMIDSAHDFVPESAPAVALKPSGHSHDIRKALTINDRFRFRRELFAGDDVAMNEFLDNLSACETLEQADAYLSTMPWDHDSEVIGEFMTIVANHFNSFRQ